VSWAVTHGVDYGADPNGSSFPVIQQARPVAAIATLTPT
jgi:hypothetical protein